MRNINSGESLAWRGGMGHKIPNERHTCMQNNNVVLLTERVVAFAGFYAKIYTTTRIVYILVNSKRFIK